MASLRAELTGKPEPAAQAAPSPKEGRESTPEAKPARAKGGAKTTTPPAATATPPTPAAPSAPAAAPAPASAKAAEPVRERTKPDGPVRAATAAGDNMVRIRLRPGTMAMAFSSAVCVFWVGASAAFLWGYFGAQGLSALGPHLLAFAATITFVPPFLFIAAAYALVRAQSMGEAARRLVTASERLTLADDHAVNASYRLGRVVRRELDALSAGLDGAFTRLRALETALEDRVAQLEEAGARAGVTTEAISRRLGEERQRIEQATEALDSTASRAAEIWAGKSTQVTEALALRLREERQNIEKLAEGLDQAAFRAAENLRARSAEATGAIAERLNDERKGIEQLAQSLDQTAARAVESLSTRSAEVTETMARRLSKERETIDGLAQSLDQTATRALESLTARSAEVTETMAKRLTKEREGIEQLATTLEYTSNRAAENLSARSVEIAELLARRLSKERESIEELGKALDQSATRAAEDLTGRSTDAVETMASRLAGEREAIQALADRLEQTGERAAETLATRSAQVTEAMAQRLREERQAMEELGAALDAAASRAAESLAGRSAQLKALIEAASGSLKSAGQTLEVQSAQFREAADKAAAAPHAAAVELDHQAKQIESVADNVVARAEFVLARQERQRTAMNELLTRLKEETTAFEAMLDGQRKAAETAAQQLATQAERLDELTLQGLRRVDAAMNTASSRATQIAGGFNKEAERVKDSTDAAAAAMSRLVESLREATGSAQALIADSTADAKRRSKEFVGEAMGSCDQLLRAASSVAEEAEKARASLARAAEEAERHIVALPGIAAQEAERVRETLRGETEKILDSSARSLAALQMRASGRRNAPVPEEPPQPEPPVAEPSSGEGLRALARRITGPKRRPDERERPRGNFALSAVLAAAEANDTKVVLRSGATAALATLQSALTEIAVDLDSAMSDSENPALWRRYLDGDRGVFARKMANSIGPDTVDRITGLYRDNPRFHEAADAYLLEFEALLERAREGDRGGLLASTLLSADTGKIYLTVAYALGRLE